MFVNTTDRWHTLMVNQHLNFWMVHHLLILTFHNWKRDLQDLQHNRFCFLGFGKNMLRRIVKISQKLRKREYLSMRHGCFFHIRRLLTSLIQWQDVPEREMYHQPLFHRNSKISMKTKKHKRFLHLLIQSYSQHKINLKLTT